MVGEGWDWCMGSKMVTTTCFLVMSAWVQIWLGPNPLFAPRLSVYWLIQAIHSISTLPKCHQKYNERLEKVEIGIHPPQPSPHSNFWVEGGEIWIQGPYVSHQVWVCTDWISHFISAQPIQSLIISIMNGYTYFRLVYGLYCSPQPIFWSWVGTNCTQPHRAPTTFSLW